MGLEIFSLDKIINQKKREEEENQRFEEEIGIFRSYNVGQSFGNLPIDGGDRACTSFFVSSTGVQLCFITNDNLE